MKIIVIDSNSLITDESQKSDRKLYMKIPQICQKEKLNYGDCVDLIFNEYDDEIKIGVV